MDHDPKDPTLTNPPRSAPPHLQVMPRDAVWVEEPEPELGVVDYAHLVWAHKVLVVGVLAATVVLAVAWSLTRPKLYRAETKITLHPAPQLTQNQLDMWMSWWQMDRFIADQIQVLQTRSLAQRVVDTPPTATVTDPVMCARLADMVLLVVQYAGPKRQLVREAMRLLLRTGVRIAGVLLNKVDLERDAYYYSGYYSYYHYGERPATGGAKEGRAKAG